MVGLYADSNYMLYSKMKRINDMFITWLADSFDYRTAYSIIIVLGYSIGFFLACGITILLKYLVQLIS